MRIDYNILWFEDTRSWYDSIVPDLDEYLEDFGFKLVVNLQENGKNIDSLPLSDFDLILMDLQLSSNDSGNKLIEKIRNHEVFTELVFYSQKGESAVRSLTKDLGVDGVYCTGRANEAFLDKVQKVINTTIKKVQDLNNMRGLVLAEVSDIEYKMKEIILDYVNFTEAKNVGIFKQKIKDKVLKTIQDKLKKFESFDVNTQIEKIVSHPDFDLYTKWRVIKNILDDLSSQGGLKEITDTFEKFEEEIRKKRNKYAHVKEKIDKSTGKRFFEGDENFVFDDAACTNIRKDLTTHLENLESLQKIIKNLN